MLLQDAYAIGPQNEMMLGTQVLTPPRGSHSCERGQELFFALPPMEGCSYHPALHSGPTGLGLSFKAFRPRLLCFNFRF